MAWLLATAAIALLTLAASEPSVDEFLKRQKRFVNAEDYDSAASKPNYLVAIRWTNPYSSVTKTLCSGSIIHESMILTSGGCLFHDRKTVGKEAQPIANWQLKVVAGVFDFGASHQMHEQERDVVQVYTHPDLQMTDHRKLWLNDIAIIQVNTPFTFNHHVGSIDLWLSLFAYNASTTEYYTMLRASGFGDAGSPLSVQYEDLFETHQENRVVNTPRYHYFAYVGTDGGSCGNKFPEVSDIESGLVTLAPSLPDPYSPKPIDSGKRCFYTGTRQMVGYLPTDGDWGGPIVWTSPDNFQEYQVFLLPKMPAVRATFETDQNYQVWGEWLGYYDRFIGEAWDQITAVPSSDRQVSLSPMSHTQTFTKTVPVDYFGNHQWLLKLTLEEGMAGEVNITVTGSDAVSTMRNSQLNLRKSSSNKLIRSYYGAARTLTSDVTTSPSSEGTSDGRWGCEYKDPSETIPGAQAEKIFNATAVPVVANENWITIAPPLNRKRRSAATDLSTDLAENTAADGTNCKDRLFNGTDTAAPSLASFVFSTYWEEINHVVTEDFNVEFRSHKPRRSSDKGTLTITVDYRSVEMPPEATEAPATVVAEAPADAHAGHKKINEVEMRQHDGHGDHGTTTEEETDTSTSTSTSTKETFVNLCDTGYETCDDQFSCFRQSALCDMEPDCLDSQDEFRWCLDKSCLSSEYQCITGECLKLQLLCDGTCDCLDKTVCEDETLTCDNNVFPDRAAMLKFGEGGAVAAAPVEVESSDSSSSSSSSDHSGHGAHAGHKKTGTSSSAGNLVGCVMVLVIGFVMTSFAM